jgi:hypothetical protein
MSLKIKSYAVLIISVLKSFVLPFYRCNLLGNRTDEVKLHYCNVKLTPLFFRSYPSFSVQLLAPRRLGEAAILTLDMESHKSVHTCPLIGLPYFRFESS